MTRWLNALNRCFCIFSSSSSLFLTTYFQLIHHTQTHTNKKKNHVHFVRCHFSVTFLHLFDGLCATLNRICSFAAFFMYKYNSNSIPCTRFYFFSQIKPQYECSGIFEWFKVHRKLYLPFILWFADLQSNLFELYGFRGFFLFLSVRSSKYVWWRDGGIGKWILWKRRKKKLKWRKLENNRNEHKVKVSIMDFSFTPI